MTILDIVSRDAFQESTLDSGPGGPGGHGGRWYAGPDAKHKQTQPPNTAATKRGWSLGGVARGGALGALVLGGVAGAVVASSDEIRKSLMENVSAALAELRRVRDAPAHMERLRVQIGDIKGDFDAHLRAQNLEITSIKETIEAIQAQRAAEAAYATKRESEHAANLDARHATDMTEREEDRASTFKYIQDSLKYVGNTDTLIASATQMLEEAAERHQELHEHTLEQVRSLVTRATNNEGTPDATDTLAQIEGIKRDIAINFDQAEHLDKKARDTLEACIRLKEEITESIQENARAATKKPALSEKAQSSPNGCNVSSGSTPRADARDAAGRGRGRGASAGGSPLQQSKSGKNPTFGLRRYV
jgi:hypothetical protein